MHTFYEFFAGGGMVRTGLGNEWTCLFANDIDARKGDAYIANWGTDRLLIEDVGKVTLHQIPSRADLAWASFPCQDLSIAGAGAGLMGRRSSTFWFFWSLIQQLIEERRSPRIVILENVCGMLSSNGGKDFAAICRAFVEANYHLGALVVDAVHFIPQSRPRLFLIGVETGTEIPDELTTATPSAIWHPSMLVNAYRKLPTYSKEGWLWWNPPVPAMRRQSFSGLIEDQPIGVRWHTAAETDHLLSIMSPIHRQKVEQARQMKRRMIGSIYKRTRIDTNGARIQRAEIRFDDIAGCLRTPKGGSSRQSILIVEGERTRSRLISPREAARLMGLPDTYLLPEKYNEAYHLIGDGVAVPVVRFLAQHLLEPMLRVTTKEERNVA